jgi:hypothetical protein
MNSSAILRCHLFHCMLIQIMSVKKVTICRQRKCFVIGSISMKLAYQGGGAAILTCLIQSIHSTRLKDHRSTINICKTISLFQEAAIGFPSSVISLDKFNQPYQLPIYRHFNETFSICNCSKLQDRVNPYPIYEKSDLGIGDSSKTVPNYLSSSSSSSFQCDILHGSSLCPTDNIDLVENLPLWGFIDINWNEYIARSGRLLWPTCTMEETTKEGLHNQYRLFQRRQCN